MSETNHSSPQQLAEHAAQTTQKEISGFRDFLVNQNVIGIAVGLAVGGAASSLATSFVNNIILDPISFFFGSTEGLAGLTLPLGYKDGVLVTFNYGTFLSALVNFIIIALVFYLIIRFFKLDKKPSSSTKK